MVQIQFLDQFLSFLFIGNLYFNIVGFYLSNFDDFTYTSVILVNRWWLNLIFLGDFYFQKLNFLNFLIFFIRKNLNFRRLFEILVLKNDFLRWFILIQKYINGQNLMYILKFFMILAIFQNLTKVIIRKYQMYSKFVQLIHF